MSTLFECLIAAAFVLPAVFRWQRRRAGLRAGGLTPQFQKRLIGFTLLSSLMLVFGLAGMAHAENGDPDGSKTPSAVDSGIQAGTVTNADGTKTVTSAADANNALTAEVSHNKLGLNLLWLIVGGVLVLFMQAGFALVETGFTRAKNAAHTMMMNLVIFALGVVGWFVCGYAFMFGSTTNSTVGMTATGTPLHLGSWNILEIGRAHV